MDATVVLLLAYAALFAWAGAWIARRVRGADDFFVAGRALPAPLVFATLLAANIGAGSTVGATGLAYRHGLSAWWWSGSAALGCLALGLVVAPRLHALASANGFLTVGDFLEARYDRSLRGLVAVVLALGSLLILAGQILAMAWAFEVVAGVPKPWGCLLGGLTLVASVGRGGLLSSAWVNLLELVVLLGGFVLAVPFAWTAAGGWRALSAAGGATPGYASPAGMGAGPILGLLLALGPSFVVSPGLVQKTFGARTPAAARAAVLVNAAALALFAFIPALLGMAARALRPELPNAELALPVLLREVLPPWLGALGLAALFAAEVSTADAVLFMLATSLSRDLYQRFADPRADAQRLLRVGRWAALLGGAAGVGLALVTPSVVAALRGFYGILTAALFVPLLWGLLSARPGPRHARAAVVLAVAATLGVPLLAPAAPPWLAAAVALAAAAAAMAWGRRRPPERA